MTKKKRLHPEKVKFAVVGLGHIAQAAVLPAFAHAKEHAELTALVSGSPMKLSELGEKYGVKEIFLYEDYDRMLDEGLVHAVYIALPNRLHADFAVRALRKGVHVLCEKPLATTEEDCRRMVEAARESGAKLMTAYRLHFEESNLKAIDLAREHIGPPRFFSSTFSYRLEDPANIRLRAEEGGPLWDIGIYCINAARYLFASEPLEVTAFSAASSEPRFAEVPESVAVTMKFPGERLANFVCSFATEASADFEIFGPRGRLRLKNAYEYKEARELILTVDGKEEAHRFRKSDQFAPQLIYFAECVRRNEMPETSGYEGWADVRIMLAIEESLRKGERVILGGAPRFLADKPRPDLSQWIQKPPVHEPPVVQPGKAKGEEAA